MSNNKIKWTDEIDTYIKANINKITSHVLAQEIEDNFGLKVLSSSVLYRARNILGCRMNGIGKFTRNLKQSTVKSFIDDTTPLNSGITLAQSNNSHCLYMTSPSADSDICGKPRAGHSSFCDKHHEICYHVNTDRTTTDKSLRKHKIAVDNGEYV